MKVWRWMFVGIVAVMLTACGGGGGSGEPTAIERIASYAQDGGTPPTVQLYADARVMGVTEENLDEINAVVAGLTYEDVDTPEEVQRYVDALGGDSTKPKGQLKKTGQTKSYDEDGNEVTDDSIKDDGYYQAGIDPNYTRDDAKQIVTDHITGLEWQDDGNASSVTKQWLTDANYDTCDDNNSAPECYDTSGDTAVTYCANLNLDGGGWRLPTRKELVSLSDYSTTSPAMHSAFDHVASYFYWSSTTYAGYTSYAWSVYFYSGSQGNYNKSSSFYVRCVRAGQ